MTKSGKLGVVIIGATVLIALILAGLFYPIGAASGAPSRTPATNAGPNSADSYREAIALLQTLESDAAQRDQLARYEDGRFDDGAAAFFARHEDIVAKLRAGAMAERCDWGEPRMQERVTSLKRLRGFAILTLLRSSHARQQQDAGLMLDDILATMALARHVGSDGLLVDKLVEVGVESKAINQLAAALLMLSPEQLNRCAGGWMRCRNQSPART